MHMNDLATALNENYPNTMANQTRPTYYDFVLQNPARGWID